MLHKYITRAQEQYKFVSQLQQYHILDAFSLVEYYQKNKTIPEEIKYYRGAHFNPQHTFGEIKYILDNFLRNFDDKFMSTTCNLYGKVIKVGENYTIICTDPHNLHAADAKIVKNKKVMRVGEWAILVKRADIDEYSKEFSTTPQSDFVKYYQNIEELLPRIEKSETKIEPGEYYSSNVGTVTRLIPINEIDFDKIVEIFCINLDESTQNYYQSIIGYDLTRQNSSELEFMNRVIKITYLKN